MNSTFQHLNPILKIKHGVHATLKKIILAAIIILSAANLKSQDSEIQTLFSGNTRISGFGGPFMSFTTVRGQFAHMMGGGGGVLLGDFFIGGYGEGITNEIPVGGERLNFGHGGFWTGYSFMANRPIHPSFSTQIGWGSVFEGSYENSYIIPDAIFVFNPAIELEMNFTRFFRLSIGVHYRMVTGVNQEMPNNPISNADLSGPGALLAFKFGWF